MHCRICVMKKRWGPFMKVRSAQMKQNWLEQTFKKIQRKIMAWDFGLLYWGKPMRWLTSVAWHRQQWKEKELWKIGYLFQKAHWYQRLCKAEVAIACAVEYAVHCPDADSVLALWFGTNNIIASQKCCCSEMVWKSLIKLPAKESLEYGMNSFYILAELTKRLFRQEL